MGHAGAIAPARDGVEAFSAALRQSGFAGDFEESLPARQVAATDNSIYEIRPAAIVYPRGGDDVNRIVAAAVSARASAPVSLTARGGNTGTNGQSLNDGIVVDFARHMNAILALDVEGRSVTVEPGVVLDQLNAALEPHGLFFPPTVSTASRATIGGMVATDASGKGSRHYGKTSDYILGLDVVLADGSDHQVAPMTLAEAETLGRGAGRVARIHAEAARIVRDRAGTIAKVFPAMNRGLTGYNLQKAYDAAADRFSLAYLLAGSEGTLALTKAITLRVAPKPAARALAVLRYDDFDAALRDVQRLLAADPLAVEILDDKVMSVARTDVIWSGIEEVLGHTGTAEVKALNFVEFAGMTDSAVEDGLDRLAALLGETAAGLIDWTIVRDPKLIATLWTLREKSVGLLARLGGGRQGIPFVEDTAVPPERLADYVEAFRALLDRRGLHYGMFGHADVGCLHVRPFIDMKDPAQAALIRPVSDEVAALTKRHGGLLWGEHGRGFRGEYSPLFFGPDLYPELRRIKAAFDPGNLFNPGKLAAPSAGGRIDRIDGIAFRGTSDGLIDDALLRDFDRAVACNGNGACFSWDALDVLCPSYKATRDRAQSPKGRAALLRSWSRLRSASTPGDPAELEAIEAGLVASLATCLSCKACTTLCPVKVDVPAMKSRFLDHYHDRHARPFRHRLLALAEAAFAAGRAAPRLANRLLGTAPARRAIARLGLVDLPRFAPLRANPAAAVDVALLARSGADERRRTLVIVEDTFTASYDGRVLAAAYESLGRLGYVVYRLPPRANGKILHILGMRARFARLAAARVAECRRIAACGVRLVGLDAATALMFAEEYREFAGDAPVEVQGVEAVLAADIAAGLIRPRPAAAADAYRLLGHCTETALRPQALAQWAAIFAHVGLRAEPVRTGCCGMAGLFGHEQANLAMSRRLFDLSWRAAVEAAPDTVLATGYSCRSQAARFAGLRPRHPLEAIADHLSKEPTP